MKKNLFNKFWLRVGMLVAVMTTALAGTAWATDLEFSLDELYQNGTKVTTKTVIATKGGTLTFTDANENFTILLTRNSSNQPGYYTSQGYLRFYSSDTFKLSAAEGITMTKVVVTSNGSSFDVQTMTGLDKNTKTWTGTASEVTFTGSGTNKWDKITITYSTGGSSAVATTTTIDASGITNNDVYTGTEAGSLAATVKAGNSAISGATVAWSSSDEDVATIDADGAVTLVGAGTVTFTATYAGVANTYQSSSATYGMTVTDSTPDYVTLPYSWAGGAKDDLLAETGVTANGLGSDYAASNAPYLVKLDTTGDYIQVKTDSQPSKVTIGVKMAGGSNTSTITVQESADGETFTDVEDLTISGAQNAVLTLETSTAFKAASRYVRLLFTKGSNVGVGPITITKFSTDPSISASDVNIAYNATNGSINYTISNPVAGTSLTASTTANWISNFVVGASAVTFTTTANEVTESRSATVTLTYGSVTKDVTVTQAAAPVIYNTIPDIFAAATGTETDVYVNFGGWAVSGVKGSNAYLTDNQGNGLIIYASEHGFQVDDVLTGIVSCKLQLYRGSAELTNLTSSTEGLSVAHNGTVTEANIAMADLAGVNTGALVSYENLTCSVTTSGNYTNYDLTDGTTTIRAYTTLYDFTTTPGLEDGKTYNIKGIFLQYTTNSASTKEILPRSAADIEEVVNPSITVDPDLVEEDAEEHDGTLDITYENLTIGDMTDFGIQYYDAEGEETTEPDWIEVLVAEAEGGEGYVVSYYMVENEGEARTAYFKVFAMGDEDFVYSNLVTVNQAAPVVPPTGDQYELFRGAELGKELEEGDYLIVYDGAAMSNVVTSGRLQYEEVTAVNDVITTDNAAIVWHIAPSDEYWTIYNADANAYAASTGVKNKAQMLAGETDDKALWTVNTVEDGYDFINKFNADGNVNAYLRNNKDTNQNYGFACYAAGTGGALSLYKKVEEVVPTSQTVKVSAAGYATFVTEAHLEIPAGVEVFAVTVNDAATSAHLEPITGGIPYGVPVLVSASEGTYEFPIAAEEVEPLSIDNDLVAATAAVTADGSQYCLAQKSDVVGFYKVQAGIVIPAGKAYLVVTSPAGQAKAFYGFDDDATGIETIDNGQLTTDNGVIYNLAGQRLQKMQRGINIVNGKKILK